MIERLNLHDREFDIYMIAEKLNEVIDVVNRRAILDETDHPKVAEFCRKAVRTGSHADLKAYLDMRRKYL